jgi:hypothetical protein
MIQPGDVSWQEIERAKEFVRRPLSEGFKAWALLRDRDNVTLTIQELGHLMAWYVAIRMEPLTERMALEAAQLGLEAENAR